MYSTHAPLFFMFFSTYMHHTYTAMSLTGEVFEAAGFVQRHPTVLLNMLAFALMSAIGQVRGRSITSCPSLLPTLPAFSPARGKAGTRVAGTTTLHTYTHTHTACMYTTLTHAHIHTHIHSAHTHMHTHTHTHITDIHLHNDNKLWTSNVFNLHDHQKVLHNPRLCPHIRKLSS